MTKIFVNDRIIESDNPTLVIKAAIDTLVTINPVDDSIIPANLEEVRAWALSFLGDMMQESKNGAGLTEAMYYEALRWQDNPSSRLALNPGRLSNEDYTNQVISRWDKIESDYNLGVSLVNQAGDVDTIAVILSRRG